MFFRELMADVFGKENEDTVVRSAVGL